MKLKPLLTLGVILFVVGWACAPSYAQQHRATHLGNPNTRFAPPLKTPEDLRALFQNPQLQADIGAILAQSDWQGNQEDLRSAAATADIRELRIPPGTRLPAMSTRKKGQPVLLKDILWAGKKPFEAYEFKFISNDRRYRVVTPKACSNFWVERLERELYPGLEAIKTFTIASQRSRAHLTRFEILPVSEVLLDSRHIRRDQPLRNRACVGSRVTIPA